MSNFSRFQPGKGRVKGRTPKGGPLKRFAGIFWPPKWRKHSDCPRGAGTQVTVALETLFHMTEMQAHEDRNPMLQICPGSRTTNFDPQIFFFEMFDSSRNEQWPSNLVMIRRGVILPPFLSGIFFLRRSTMNIQANHQPVFHRIVATWVLICPLRTIGAPGR